MVYLRLMAFMYIMCLIAQSCLTLCNPMDCNPLGSSVHGDSPDKNTGVDCHPLLQGLFPRQGLNPGLLHWADSLLSKPPGKPTDHHIFVQS